MGERRMLLRLIGGLSARDVMVSLMCFFCFMTTNAPVAFKPAI